MLPAVIALAAIRTINLGESGMNKSFVAMMSTAALASPIPIQ